MLDSDSVMPKTEQTSSSISLAARSISTGGIGAPPHRELRNFDGRVFTDQCIARFIKGELDAVDAAMAKMWLSNLHCKVVDECLQLFGGWGYMWECPIARAYGDARVVKIAGRSIEVMDGALFSTLACGRRWIRDGLPGSVVSMLVTWVWTGSAYVLPSTMAKTAVHAMTMSLAVEWGKHHIRVNAVAPGPFPTESAWEKLAPIPKANVGAASADEVPMGRFGRMPELCNLLTFLQADGCDYLTGQNIAIDGGHHLAAPSTFATLGKLTPEDWAEAKALVRGRAEQEEAQRSTG